MGNPPTTKDGLSNVEDVDAEGCYVFDRLDLAERSRTNIPSLWLYCSCPYVSHSVAKSQRYVVFDAYLEYSKGVIEMFHEIRWTRGFVKIPPGYGNQ